MSGAKARLRLKVSVYVLAATLWEAVQMNDSEAKCKSDEFGTGKGNIPDGNRNPVKYDWRSVKFGK